jgi:hypothetical protein
LRSLHGTQPAVLRDLGQRSRRRSVHHHLHIVKWRVRGAVGRHPPLLLDRVLRSVPAADRQIEPAGECQRIIDNDDFLMLRAAERHGVIQA